MPTENDRFSALHELDDHFDRLARRSNFVTTAGMFTPEDISVLRVKLKQVAELSSGLVADDDYRLLNQLEVIAGDPKVGDAMKPGDYNALGRRAEALIRDIDAADTDTVREARRAHATLKADLLDDHFDDLVSRRSFITTAGSFTPEDISVLRVKAEEVATLTGRPIPADDHRTLNQLEVIAGDPKVGDAMKSRDYNALGERAEALVLRTAREEADAIEEAAAAGSKAGKALGPLRYVAAPVIAATIAGVASAAEGDDIGVIAKTMGGAALESNPVGQIVMAPTDDERRVRSSVEAASTVAVAGGGTAAATGVGVIPGAVVAVAGPFLADEGTRLYARYIDGKYETVDASTGEKAVVAVAGINAHALMNDTAIAAENTLGNWLEGEKPYRITVDDSMTPAEKQRVVEEAYAAGKCIGDAGCSVQEVPADPTAPSVSVQSVRREPSSTSKGLGGPGA